MIFLSSFFEKHVLNIFDTFINNQKVTGKFFNTSNWYVFIVKYHTVILKILNSNMKQKLFTASCKDFRFFSMPIVVSLKTASYNKYTFTTYFFHQNMLGLTFGQYIFIYLIKMYVLQGGLKKIASPSWMFNFFLYLRKVSKVPLCIHKSLMLSNKDYRIVLNY